MPKPVPPPQRVVQPSEEHAQVALREAAVLMAPVVRWLLRNGVSYPSFNDRLKAVFVEVAREELAGSGARPTHSALSVLSGVHRKDVRVLADASPRAATVPSVPLASQVFTRWLTDAAWRGADGAPRPLPRSGPEPSFEALARQLSTDVHPRTVLDELLRLGLVGIDGDLVTPRAAAFVPAQGLAETSALFAANVSDHIAAAVHNLTLSGPKFLEQALFADGLTEASARELAQAARAAWVRAFEGMAAQARTKVDADAAHDGPFRVRFGSYFYSERALPGAGSDAAPSDDKT